MNYYYIKIIMCELLIYAKILLFLLHRVIHFNSSKDTELPSQEPI